MASLTSQTFKCLLFRNVNLICSMTAAKKNLHNFSSVPALSKVLIKHAQNTQFLAFSTNDIQDIESRVLKVVSSYDKISAVKHTKESHFVQDLGLDSLDHVEVIMAIEDEFGFEIPDNEAEKLARPIDIIKYISEREETN